MTIVNNIDLIQDVKKYDVVLIATSVLNSLGNGFQHKVAISFPYVSKENKACLYGDKSRLGTCKVIEGEPKFILCYIHCGRFRPDKIPDVVDYEALEKCLTLVNNNFKGLKVACTILGNSPFEGGGDREKCLGLLEACLKDVDLYVYDYEQVDYRIEDAQNHANIEKAYKLKIINKDVYYELKKQFIWHRRKGLYKPVPKDISYRKMQLMFKNGEFDNV